MSVRALAVIAILLAALIGTVVFVALDRLGYRQEWTVPGWKFENQLLKAPSGTRVIVRSTDPDAVKARFMFERTVTEPVVNRDREPKPNDPPALPYRLLWVETMRAEETDWRFTSLSYAALAQMGARSTREWLEELGPVRERLPDGSTRILLRARFGQESGGTAFYFFDPDEADGAARGFGWVRMEIRAGDRPEISYSFPAGRYIRR